MDVCPTCGGEFFAIGQHWNKSECEYPKLDSKQHDVVTGVLMGDGCISRSNSTNRKPRLEVSNIQKTYLEHIADVLGVYSNEVTIKQTAAEVAQSLRDSRLHRDTSKDDCSDLYILRTTTSPVFHTFADWYETGEKVFPETLSLTPTVLSHWYSCDGHCSKDVDYPKVSISMCNEKDNKNKIESYFREIDIPISYWNENTRKDGSKRCSAQFTKEPSAKLFEYMGDPLPGFAYKWFEDYGPTDTVTA